MAENEPIETEPTEEEVKAAEQDVEGHSISEPEADQSLVLDVNFGCA